MNLSQYSKKGLFMFEIEVSEHVILWWISEKAYFPKRELLSKTLQGG